MLTIDASGLVGALIDGTDHGHRVRSRLRGDRLIAPEMIDLEVVSVLRRLHAARRLSTIGAETAIGELLQLPLQRVPHRGLTRRIWELRDNAGPYDAAYIATAEITGSTLVTIDTKLAGTPGITCPVEVLR